MSPDTSPKGHADFELHARLQSLAGEIGYPVEAIMLVLHAVNTAPHYLSRAGGHASPTDGHLSAKDVCTALIECAKGRYRDRALESLERWDLNSSEDVGRVVAAIVKSGLLGAAAGDSEADFQGLYSHEDIVQQLTGLEPANEQSAHRTSQTKVRTTVIPRLVAEFFHPHDVQQLIITERIWPARVRVDLQMTLDRYFGQDVEVNHFSGIRREYSHNGLSLHDVIVFSRHENAAAVPPQYEEVDVGEDVPAKCLSNGLWLAASRGRRFALLMARAEEYGRQLGMKFQLATVNDQDALAFTGEFFRTLERAVNECRSYRGKVLSLETSDRYYSGTSTGIRVHKLRTVNREHVILPRRTLELLERNVIHFVERRQRLSQMGMQVKKGLLFYGPPGTGKTHTIHYLAGALPGHTTLLITAEQVGLLPEYMTLARLLQPSIMVIEDADLIARERRSMNSPCEEVMLNKLLNEMDGLKGDAEVLFILTTNRPEMLEPALAARPGRIDQAIEFPLPDADGRTKLIRMYAFGAAVDSPTLEAIVRKTDGVSAAFIKELMRRAAQFHMERSTTCEVDVGDINSALEEMLFAGGSLNRQLLGAAIAAEPS